MKADDLMVGGIVLRKGRTALPDYQRRKLLLIPARLSRIYSNFATEVATTNIFKTPD